MSLPFKEREKLFIFDGNSFCYRAYYAIKGLSTSKGMPTNAVFGFVNMLKKIIEEENPRYLAVTFDMKGPTFRHKLFEEYKIKRPPMPNDLVIQMDIIKEIVKAYNIPIFEKEGYEADDLIATMVSKLKSQRLFIYLVTADKDVLQLIDDMVFIYNPYRKDNPISDLKYVNEKYKLKPEMIPDFLALVGDEIDNIPGIRGIGEKTAVQLLEKYQSLENLLSHIEEIEKEEIRHTLEKEKDKIILNKKLALLNKDIPLEVNLDDLRIKSPDKNRLFRIFKELEFKSFLRDLVKDDIIKLGIEIERIKEDKKFDTFLDKIKKEKIFSFILKIGENLKLEGVYIGCEGDKVFYIDLTEINKETIAKLFSNENLIKVCYDIKTIRKVINENNTLIKGKIFDIMLISYLLNPSAGNYSLADIALEYLDFLPSFIFREVSDEIYNQESVKIMLRLFNLLNKELLEKELLDLYLNLELPLIDVLISMEKKGVYINIEFLKDFSEELNRKTQEIKKEIFQIAEREFNLDSPKQLREILFDKLKLPIIKRVKTGPSTDEEVLIKLSEFNRLPKLILEYRELAKLKSTYVEGFLSAVDKKTQRIHTTFSQINTETGRLSSSQPNLQNIPIKTELGKKIRKAISVPDRNHLLLSADYSQIELRILAHLSQDDALIEAFNKGIDIHTHTASIIFCLPMEKISQEMRSFAKTINFGIIYGMSSFGLSKELNISIEEAEKFIATYFMRYPKVKKYMEEKIEEAKTKGYVTTLLNRRRYVPYLNSHNQLIRQFAERVAVNTPVQGSAADIIKLAMVNIYKKILTKNLNAFLILQIHDELLFESHKNSFNDLVELVKEEMENVIKLKVPLRVSLKKGDNWAEMEVFN